MKMRITIQKGFQFIRYEMSDENIKLTFSTSLVIKANNEIGSSQAISVIVLQRQYIY